MAARASGANTPVALHCSRCGDDGHSVQDCWSPQRVCWNCHEHGHRSSKCPRPRGILNRICGGCKEKGHIASECPVRSQWVCNNCADQGHGHWECRKPRGYLRMKCSFCGGVGHLSDDCTNVTDWICKNCNEQGHLYETCRKPRGYLKRVCRECGQAGHVVAECPRRLCFRCGTIGHLSAFCTHPISIAVCHRCGSQKHLTKDCPVFKPAAPTPQPRREHSRSCTCTTCNRARPSPTNEKDSTPAGAMRIWRHAMAAFAAEEYADAVRLLTDAISIDPTRWIFYSTRGTSHYRSGTHAAALRDFQHALNCAGYTPTAEVLVQTARCRLRLGSRGAALLAVREALNVDPADEAARTLKRRLTRMEEAEEAYRQARAGGRWRAARTARETCVGLYEEEECVVPVEVRCWSVHLAVAERAWEEAKSAVDKLLAEEPQAIDVLLAKITVLFFAGDIPEALEQAKAALKFDPDNVALKTAWTRIKNVSRHEVRGRAYNLFREYEAELKCWGRALEFVPDRLEDGGGGLLRASLLFNKARAELKLKQYAEGLKSIDASLKLDDLRWKPYLIRGRIQVGLELFDLAVEDFKICLQRALLKASDASTDDIELLESELKRTERLAAKAKTKLKDYYQILGLKPTCTSAEIRRAYQTESLKHHPDKGGIEEKFKLVNEAYSTLSDLDARLMYDAKRARESRRSTYSAGRRVLLG